MSNRETRLDAIVVNFHSARLIGRTIAIVREFAGAGTRLIMVDNSPGDGAAEIARSADPGATVIENRVNRGYAAAINQAVTVADADFLLLINPDVGRISGSYADMLDAFRNHRVGAVVTRLLNSDGTLQPNCICAPRPFDLISEDIALAARFPNWSGRAGTACWIGITARLGRSMRRGVHVFSFAVQPSVTSACSTSASSSTTRRPTG